MFSQFRYFPRQRPCWVGRHRADKLDFTCPTTAKLDRTTNDGRPAQTKQVRTALTSSTQRRDSTDQKVGSSNPSERTENFLVREVNGVNLFRKLRRDSNADSNPVDEPFVWPLGLREEKRLYEALQVLDSQFQGITLANAFLRYVRRGEVANASRRNLGHGPGLGTLHLSGSARPIGCDGQGLEPFRRRLARPARTDRR